MQTPTAKVSLAKKIKKNTEELGILHIDNTKDIAFALHTTLKKPKRDTMAFWYFLKVNYIKIKPQTDRKPSMDKNDYITKLQQDLAQKFIELNGTEFGALIQAPDVIYGQVIAVLKRELIDPWYANSNGLRETKGDPKGKERIEKIENAYWDIVKNDRKHILGNFGTASFRYSEGGECTACFISADKSEALSVSLAKSRTVRYETNGKENKKVVLGGSVSTTTLKQVKSDIKKLAGSTHNKEYYRVLANFLESVI